MCRTYRTQNLLDENTPGRNNSVPGKVRQFTRADLHLPSKGLYLLDCLRAALHWIAGSKALEFRIENSKLSEYTNTRLVTYYFGTTLLLIIVYAIFASLVRSQKPPSGAPARPH